MRVLIRQIVVINFSKKSNSSILNASIYSDFIVTYRQVAQNHRFVWR